MSWSTCSRAGGAVLHTALRVSGVAWNLLQMQRDMDLLAAAARNPHAHLALRQRPHQPHFRRRG